MKLKLWSICLLTNVLAAAAWAGENFALPPELANVTAAEKGLQRERGAAVLARIADAAKTPGSTVALDAGTHYRFNSAQLRRGSSVLINLSGADGLTIEGNGATLWVEDFLSLAYLADCRNLTIRNLTVDYDPLPWLQGTVVRLGPGRRLTLRIHPGFEPTMERFLLLQQQGRIGHIAVNAHDPVTGQLRPDSLLFNTRRLEPGATPGEIEFELNPAIPPHALAAGDSLSLVIRLGTVISQYRCAGTRFERLTLYTSPGLALYERYNTASSLYRDLRLVPRPGTRRLLSTVADGIHANAGKAGITVTGCTFDSLGDDGVNFHGFYSLVMAKLSPRRYRLAPLLLRNFETGGKLDFYALPELKALGSATVVTWTSSNDPELLRRARQLHHESNRLQPEARLMNMASLEVLDVELDRDLDLPLYTVVGSSGYLCAGSVVTDCQFRNIRGRGVMVSSDRFRIERCTFDWISGPAIELALDLPWMSGPGSHDGRIVGNTVRDVGFSLDSRAHYKTAVGAICSHVYVPGRLSSVDVHGGIVIENNTIENSGLAGIALLNCAGGAIRRNHIVNPNSRAPGRLGEKLGIDCRYGIVIGGSDGITVEANRIELSSPYSAGPEKRY